MPVLRGVMSGGFDRLDERDFSFVCTNTSCNFGSRGRERKRGRRSAHECIHRHEPSSQSVREAVSESGSCRSVRSMPLRHPGTIKEVADPDAEKGATSSFIIVASCFHSSSPTRLATQQLETLWRKYLAPHDVWTESSSPTFRRAGRL